MNKKMAGVGLIIAAFIGGITIVIHNPKPVPKPKEVVPAVVAPPIIQVIEKEKPLPFVEVKHPILKEMDDELTVSGEVNAWQEYIVGSELGGIRVDQVLVDVGQVVEKNQVLAVLNSEIITAELNVAKAGVSEAQANLKQAKENADRARSLDKTSALSAQQMHQYLTFETTAQAKLESAIANLELKKVKLAQTKIKSPDSGIVSDRKVAVGNIVGGGDLFRIVNQEKLQWKPQVSVEKLDLIKKGNEISILSKSGKVIKAKVSEISPKVNIDTRKATLIVDLTKDIHKGAIYPGMFLNGFIKVGKKKALMIPSESVFEKDDKNYVFVVSDHNKVKKTKVELGKKDGNSIEVISGITLKDKIVKDEDDIEMLNDGDLVSVEKQTKK